MKKTAGVILGFVLSILAVCFCDASEADWSKPVLIEQSQIPQLPSGISGLKLRGMTMIRVEINAAGLVTGSRAITSSGSEKLDQFIQSWIKEWKYLPRLQDNRPASGFSMVVIHFDLRTQSFQAPSPISEAIQIPDVLVNVLLQADSADNDVSQPDSVIAAEQIPSSSGAFHVALCTTG